MNWQVESYRWYARVHNWDEANKWLNEGRDKNLRPLYHASLFVRRLDPADPDSPIGVGWFHKYARQDPDRMNNNTILVYYKTGHALLLGYMSHSPSARRAMLYYGNLVDIYKRGGHIYIRQSTDVPRKRLRRPCSKCKGMKVWISRDEVTGDLIKEPCNQCHDGYKVSRQTFDSFKWPTEAVSTKVHYQEEPVLRDVHQPILLTVNDGLIVKAVSLSGIEESEVEDDVHNA